MAAKTKSAAKKEPHPYEFLGPPGAFIITTFLPILVYLFTFACNDISGCPAPSLLSPSTLDWQQLKREIGWPADGIWGFASWRATGWTLAYYFLSAVLWRLLPGTEVDGVVLQSGGRLKYKFNTLSSNMLILSVLAAGTLAQGSSFAPWVFISENYLQIVTANNFIAYFLAGFCYVRSFGVVPGNAEHRELAAGGCSGNMLYDFFIGRELNPRVNIPLLGEIDIKEFMELRPGMLGWIVLNCANIAKQHRTFGFVTDGIVFITAIQAIYIIDSWYMEPAILTTMDITTDGFGFMLSYGDLAWLPFTYSLQTRYLATHPVSLGWVGLGAMFALLITGYSIFRATNSEKNMFRTNPDDPRVAHLKYIETKSGSKLLISGWWGVSRHVNYFGDWIQAWPYCLPTGAAGYAVLAAGTGMPGAHVMADGREVVPGAARGWGMLVTYFYIVYFAVLLVHRARRDDEKCHRKYGDDWETYKRIVRWRIIPYVY